MDLFVWWCVAPLLWGERPPGGLWISFVLRGPTILLRGGSALLIQAVPFPLLCLLCPAICGFICLCRRRFTQTIEKPCVFNSCSQKTLNNIVFSYFFEIAARLAGRPGVATAKSATASGSGLTPTRPHPGPKSRQKHRGFLIFQQEVLKSIGFCLFLG